MRYDEGSVAVEFFVHGITLAALQVQAKATIESLLGYPMPEGALWAWHMDVAAHVLTEASVQVWRGYVRCQVDSMGDVAAP